MTLNVCYVLGPQGGGCSRSPGKCDQQNGSDNPRTHQSQEAGLCVANSSTAPILGWPHSRWNSVSQTSGTLLE